MCAGLETAGWPEVGRLLNRAVQIAAGGLEPGELCVRIHPHHWPDGLQGSAANCRSEATRALTLAKRAVER